ncbi:hypothetical protein [Streptomyces sp. SID12501]|uniref:Uncharacterized protein n=1 Tax=Streptomyces sp. SID12501 TaxID=2706042 RepID=A0A6B3BUG5_9ACTN|nr:hypothetical protein [Streptomyces sp. SID12501]
MTRVRFSPDGSSLATVTSHGGDWRSTSEVRLWDLSTGEITTTFDERSANSLVFSPDGRYLAVHHLDGINVRDTTSGRVMAAIRITGTARGIQGVAMAPDGRTLAAGLNDGSVQLWNMSTGDIEATVDGENTGGTDAITVLAFSPDSRTLATASRNGTVRTWNATLPTPAEAIRRIPRAVNRDLTPQERSVYLPDQGVEPLLLEQRPPRQVTPLPMP